MDNYKICLTINGQHPARQHILENRFHLAGQGPQSVKPGYFGAIHSSPEETLASPSESTFGADRYPSIPTPRAVTGPPQCSRSPSLPHDTPVVSWRAGPAD